MTKHFLDRNIITSKEQIKEFNISARKGNTENRKQLTALPLVPKITRKNSIDSRLWMGIIAELIAKRFNVNKNFPELYRDLWSSWRMKSAHQSSSVEAYSGEENEQHRGGAMTGFDISQNCWHYLFIPTTLNVASIQYCIIEMKDFLVSTLVSLKLSNNHLSIPNIGDISTRP